MSPILQWALTLTLALYGISAALGAWRVLFGPSAQDRVLALDFVYVVGMLATLVLGIRNVSAMYFEAALLIAVTSFVSSAALAKFLLRGEVIE